MKECKPQSTPMVTRQVKNRNNKVKLHTEHSESIDEIKRVPYREAIGSLMYLANATRPDIAYAVNYLARKQLEPTEDDWNDVKRIFRYLRRSTDLGIKFTSNSEQLEALTDSSFRDCENLTSTGGYVIRLFGDTIAWRSH
ncbi:secreted RxLR effector protein 161-like [Nasonia vitripennis]|uniref:Retrovirus-related Pol polyprotein from transposon TNT 1-94 n=1 Tax=Nasonia vitripennis TaxID=7425 RepID=A0A7M7PXE7_NASVI|nr:secreted RxLR effector protein 161-like [Nasonia vitripennis]